MNLISLHSCPRSGSTWVQSIFEAHPNIKTVYQPLFSYTFKNCINKNSTKKEFNEFVNKIQKTDDEFCCMKSNLHTNYKKTNIIRFEKKNIKTIFMKNVHHHNLIETFIKLYPSIKIIGLIREPCSVIYSQINSKHEKLKDWLNGKDKNQEKEENFFGFNKWLEVKEIFYKIKEKYPENIIIVNYEDLVKNTIVEIEKICKFCNLDLHKNMRKSINLMNSKNEEYDYSVFKNEDTIEKWKGNLKNNIIEYINYNKIRVAICVSINDIKIAKGTNLSGIKKKLSYTEQFLMLYYSIKENWYFNYKIYLFHSRPFENYNLKKLEKLDITLKYINVKNLLIRPESYLVNLNCDYRLVLDCDMIALKNPNFNFNYDAQAMYGNFNYKALPEKIFKNLGLEKPNENKYMNYEIIKSINYLKLPKNSNLVKNFNNNDLWSPLNSNLINNFYKEKIDYNKKYYPIFNHGAILINNKYSRFIGNKLLLYKKNFKTNNGQNVIGYIINHITKNNWTHFNKGFNFTYNIDRLQLLTPNKKKYIDNEENLELFHYININKESIYYKKYIKKYYDFVKKITNI